MKFFKRLNPRFREWFEDVCKGIFFVMELCSGPSLQSILEDVSYQSPHDDDMRDMFLLDPLAIFFVSSNRSCQNPSFQDVCKQPDELRRENLPKFRRFLV